MKGSEYMSIASQIARINDNIASAYQGLSVKGASMPAERNSANLRRAIDSIQATDDAVRFYDYDGTILYMMSTAAALSMTDLPEPPSHEGLTTVGWNWTKEEIISSVRNNETVDVGCEYVTSDGAMHVYVRYDSDMESEISTDGGTVTGAMITLGFYFDNHGATVDWGDGEQVFYDTSTPRVYDDDLYIYTVSHIYTDCPSEHIIKIYSEGTIKIGTKNNKSFFRNDTARRAVYKIELCENIIINNYAFAYGKALETIACASVNVSYGTLYGCHSLKCITCSLKSGSRNDGWSAPTEYCTSLKAICSKKQTLLSSMCHFFLRSNYSIKRLNNTARYNYIYSSAFRSTKISGTVNLEKCREIDSYAFTGKSISRIIGLQDCEFIRAYAFDGCSVLRSIDTLTSCTVIENYAFSGCQELNTVEFPAVERIGSYAFSNCHTLDHIIIPDTATTIGASAFYGCVYARYIILRMAYNSNGGINQNAFTTITNTGEGLNSMLEWVDLTHYTTAESIPKLNCEFSSAFLTTNAKGKRIPYYVASEEMKTAFSSATNWSTGADYFTVGTPPAV